MYREPPREDPSQNHTEEGSSSVSLEHPAEQPPAVPDEYTAPAPDGGAPRPPRNNSLRQALSRAAERRTARRLARETRLEQRRTARREKRIARARERAEKARKRAERDKKPRRTREEARRPARKAVSSPSGARAEAFGRRRSIRQLCGQHPKRHLDLPRRLPQRHLRQRGGGRLSPPRRQKGRLPRPAPRCADALARVCRLAPLQGLFRALHLFMVCRHLSLCHLGGDRLPLLRRFGAAGAGSSR